MFWLVSHPLMGIRGQGLPQLGRGTGRGPFTTSGRKQQSGLCLRSLQKAAILVSQKGSVEMTVCIRGDLGLPVDWI